MEVIVVKSSRKKFKKENLQKLIQRTQFGLEDWILKKGGSYVNCRNALEASTDLFFEISPPFFPVSFFFGTIWETTINLGNGRGSSRSLPPRLLSQTTETTYVRTLRLARVSFYSPRNGQFNSFPFLLSPSFCDIFPRVHFG